MRLTGIVAILCSAVVVGNPIASKAQEQHRLYADVGYVPGFSATYNYTLVKHVSAGIGVQGYDFYPSLSYYSRFTPAVFADIRFNIRPEKKGQAFVFMDFGMNFYKRSNKYYRYNNSIERDRKNNGFYAGLGVAYMRRMTKRGGGPYVSLKMISNWHNSDKLDPYTLQPVAKLLSLDATAVFSIGFKY
jgi:hypothetical protein